MTLRFCSGSFAKFETIGSVVCVRKTDDEVPWNAMFFVIVLSKRSEKNLTGTEKKPENLSLCFIKAINRVGTIFLVARQRGTLYFLLKYDRITVTTVC